MTRTVLVFGDSNAWGWVPSENRGPLERYPDSISWPEAMAVQLGAAVRVRVDAVPARTTDLDDPVAAGHFPPLKPHDFNGRTHLPAALVKAAPVHMVILALGTNDMKTRFVRSPEAIAEAVQAVSAIAAAGGSASVYPPPSVLILAPPRLGSLVPWTQETFGGREAVSQAVGPAVADASAAAGFPVEQAGVIVGEAHGVDGVHYSRADHATLAEAMAVRVSAMLGLGS